MCIEVYSQQTSAFYICSIFSFFFNKLIPKTKFDATAIYRDVYIGY